MSRKTSNSKKVRSLLGVVIFWVFSGTLYVSPNNGDIFAQSEYPYKLVLTCGRGNSDHIALRACLIGEYDIETELELVNAGSKGFYKLHNLDESGGSEKPDGYYIPLTRHFSLRIQNANDSLILGAEIFDNLTGKTLFVDKASTYQVIAVGN